MLLNHNVFLLIHCSYKILMKSNKNVWFCNSKIHFLRSCKIFNMIDSPCDLWRSIFFYQQYISPLRILIKCRLYSIWKMQVCDNHISSWLFTYIQAWDCTCAKSNVDLWWWKIVVLIYRAKRGCRDAKHISKPHTGSCLQQFLKISGHCQDIFEKILDISRQNTGTCY